MNTLIFRNGEQSGPFEDSEIVKSLAEGSLSYDDLAWQEGLSDWQSLKTLYPPPAQPPPPLVPHPVAKLQPQVLASPRAAFTQPQPRVSAPKKQKYIALVIGGVLLLMIGWYYFSGSTSSTQKTPKATTQHSPVSAPRISSIEDVQKYVVGTWTFTGPGYIMAGYPHWVKWVLQSDGTMALYLARPNADDWGNPQPDKLTWSAITDKYSDTGQRFYGISIKGWLKPVVLTEDGSLFFAPGKNNTVADDGTVVEFTKGDKNPFSK